MRQIYFDNSTATGKRRRSAASSGDRTRTFWTFCLIRGLNPDLLDLEKSRRSLATMPARSLPYERGRPQTDAAHHCSDTLLQQKYLESFQNTRRLLSRPVELLWTLSGPCDSFHQWIAVPRSLASLHFPPFNELTTQPLLENGGGVLPHPGIEPGPFGHSASSGD